MENVEEFQGWGPLDENGHPIKEQQGDTFFSFIKSLESLGYEVDFKELRACDYGAPTTRKRFFLIARCDGKPITWPEATHGDPSELNVQLGLKNPYRTAGEVIDWSIPAPSIYTRKRPLVKNTMIRINRGIERFITGTDKPYVVNNHACFIQHYYTHQGNEVRGSGLDEPLATIPTANRFGLVTAFLTKYYGQGVGQSLNEPLHTISTRDRFGLVTVKGHPYKITDIGMRMLQPHELFKAQGFPDEYIIDKDSEGNIYPKTQQVARVGNSVPPPFAEHLVRANLPELCSVESKYRRLVAI